MSLEFITKTDLKKFGIQLLEEIKKLIGAAPAAQKKYLKGGEVKDILNISQSTLKHLRDNGTLAFSKIGGIYYYRFEDITSLLEKDKNTTDSK